MIVFFLVQSNTNNKNHHHENVIFLQLRHFQYEFNMDDDIKLASNVSTSRWWWWLYGECISFFCGITYGHVDKHTMFHGMMMKMIKSWWQWTVTTTNRLNVWKFISHCIIQISMDCRSNLILVLYLCVCGVCVRFVFFIHSIKNIHHSFGSKQQQILEHTEKNTFLFFLCLNYYKFQIFKNDD